MTIGKARPGGALPSSEPIDATEALRARRAELEAVIDGTPFMLARLSRDMRYRFISRAYARMIGRRPEDVIGRHVADILGQEGFAAVRPHIEKVLRGEPAEYELEIRFPGVGARYLHGIYTPETDAAGRLDGWIASLIDVGERRRADEVRQQLANIVDSSGDAIYSEDVDGVIVSWNRGAERLYGYAAEEAVGKSITLVLPPALLEEEAKILARVAQGEQIEHYETVRRRKDGTRQLLAFSRGQPLDPTVISPADTVTGIRDVLAGSLHVNIALALDVPAAVWPVRVDKSEAELALVNLVVNARDAMPEGGRLSISAENVRLAPEDARDGLMGEFVALRVADTGCGIPGDIVAKVFEPFFTTKAAEKGTGLGLSQVYGFARRSGGTVAIASEVGRGTTVSLYLPRSHGQVERPATDDAGQLLAAGEETVLVVEDNEDVRTVAVSLLEQLGYRTVAVDCASAALTRLAASEHPDLIFTDVVLPGDLDGLALARAVKERHPDIPTVLTTGYAKIFDSDPEFPVLRKPYQIAALARVIRQALDAAKPARPALAS
jgi:PAS domain S-box-containing protein